MSLIKNDRSTATPTDDIFNVVQNLVASVDHLMRGLEDPDHESDELLELIAGLQDVRRTAFNELEMSRETHCALKHASGALMSLQDYYLATGKPEVLQMYRDLSSYVIRLVKLGSQNGSEITACKSCDIDKHPEDVVGFVKEK